MTKFEKIKREYKELEDKYHMLSQKSKLLEEQVNDLYIEINDNTHTIKKSKQEIIRLQELIDSLTFTTDNKQKEFDSLKEELETIQIKERLASNKLTRLKPQIEEITNIEICQTALTANMKNSYRVKLGKNTNTTPIITEFCKNKKYDFLILDASMMLTNSITFSYVVIRNNTVVIGTHDNVPTMTELKGTSGQFIERVNIPRMQFLKEHILDSVRQNKNIKNKQIIPFTKPCPIGGQSKYNQEGYGWKWEWLYGIGDYTEGTYYGEMTGFSIIGIQINS